VEDALGPAQRAAQRPPVAHVALHALEVEALDRGVVGAALNREHDLVAALGRQPSHV
jgi:hypothetical protein